MRRVTNTTNLFELTEYYIRSSILRHLLKSKTSIYVLTVRSGINKINNWTLNICNIYFTWSPKMLKVESKFGLEGLVKHWLLEVDNIGEEVTILEGGEFLKVAPDTKSTRSAGSSTWLEDSNRLKDSTWALIFLPSFVGIVFNNKDYCNSFHLNLRHTITCILYSSYYYL